MSWADRLVLAFVLLIVGCSSPPPAVEKAEKAPSPEKKADAPPAWMATAFAQPRGLLRKEPGASPGYTLFAPFNSALVYLVDLDGQVVHTWKSDKAADAMYLQNDGSLL